MTTCPIPRAMRRPMLGRPGRVGRNGSRRRGWARASRLAARRASQPNRPGPTRAGTCRAGTGVGLLGRVNGTGTGSRSKRLRTVSNGIRSTAYRSSSAERITAAGEITRDPSAVTEAAWSRHTATAG